MNNLKIGDFLFRVEGDVTSIAVVTMIQSGYIAMTVIKQEPGYTYSSAWILEEIKAEGWQLLDMSMLRTQS
jgi:hypothetical protein